MRLPLPLLLLLAILIGALVASGAASPAHGAAAPRAVSVAGPEGRLPVSAGGEVAIQVRLQVEKGHHLYAPNDREYIPLTLRSGTPGFLLKDVRFPAPLALKVPFEEKPIPVFEGTIDVRATLAVAPEVAAGDRAADLVVEWQACTEEFCLDPDRAVVPLSLAVGPRQETTPTPGPVTGTAASAPVPVTTASASTATGTTSGAGGTTKDVAGGRLWQILGALLSGLFVTLTPCVYPLIPVTVSYFQQQGGSRAKAVPLALAYGSGIVVTYALLGVVMARLGSDLGSLLGIPAVAWGFVAFFVAFALSMFGLYDIALPSGLQTRLAGGDRAGILGALVLGLTLGLVAAPCVGPVAGGLMLIVAQTGDVGFGLLAFGAFGTGLALPFTVLGVFSGAMGAIPRAGAWMESVKHVFGYLLSAVAIYFVFVATGSTALTLALLAALALAAGAAAWSAAGDEGILTRALAVPLFAAGLYLLFGPYVLRADGPILPPTKLWEARVPWSDERYEAALARARAEKRPVLVDFSARWCNACHELDLTTFREDAVVAALRRFVAVKVDVTSDPANQRLKTETYKAYKLPFMAFHDSEGRLVGTLPREGASGISTEDVLRLLQETR